MKIHLINLHPCRPAPGPNWGKVMRRIYREIRMSPKASPNWEVRNLNVVYIDDLQMGNFNWKFLRHKGPTDILTFDYGEGNAEILISLDTAVRQAEVYEQSYVTELVRYHIHGLLHLAGWDDRTALRRQAMRRVENWILQRLGKTIDTLGIP